MNILIPLPNRDFDPSEVAVPWRILRQAGIDVTFATPDGRRGFADPIMLHGRGLDPWGWIPGLNRLVIIGRFLRASGFARASYREMEGDSAFQHPLRFDQLRVDDFDGMLLPGGHAKGMCAYLENAQLQQFVADFFDAVDASGRHRPVAAVCHGVVLAARSRSRLTGRSVLYGRRTTGLTWQFERKAWNLTRFLARFWDPNYYRTYLEAPDQPSGFMSVQHEVQRALASPSDFIDVTPGIAHYARKISGVVRDSIDDATPAWVVRDGHYLSARWPGDVCTLAQQLVQLVKEPSLTAPTRQP